MSMPTFDLPEGVDAGTFFTLLNTNVTAALLLLPPSFRAQLIAYLQQTASGSGNGSSTGNETGASRIIVLNTTTITILSQPNFSTEVNYIKAYAYVIILTSIIGMLGNALVMGVYGKKFRELNICKILIFHLSASDFLFSVLQMVAAAPSVHAADWPYGQTACKLIRCSLLLGSLTAVGTMLIIAIERYLGIMHSMKFTNVKQRVALLLLSVWTAAITTTVPVGIALVYDQKKKDCEEQWNHAGLTENGGKVYDISLLIFWYVVPLSIIFFCYGSIINLLRIPLHKRGFSGEKSAEFAKKRRKEDLRVVFTLIVVVVVFTLCCLPVRIMWILLKFINVNKLPESKYFALLYTGLLPYPLHVAVNPIIYSIVDHQFRKNVVELFGCKISFASFISALRPTGETSNSGKGTFLSNVNLFQMTKKYDLREKELSWFSDPPKTSDIPSSFDDSVIVTNSSISSTG